MASFFLLELFNTETWIKIFRIIIILFICKINFENKFVLKEGKVYPIDNGSKSNFSNQLNEIILGLIEKNVVKKRYYFNKSKQNKIHTIAAIDKLKYGNAIAELNNFIFICEIIKCNKVIVPKAIWNIKNKIIFKKYNITIEPIKSLNCKDINIFCLRHKLTFHFPHIIRNVFPVFDNKYKHTNRRNIIKKEIIKSTPD